MSDSRQLDVLKALTAHLEGMTAVGGYGFDMTGRVFRGVALWGAELPLPALGIIEAPVPDERPRTAGHERAFRAEDWTILVQGWVEDNDVHPTDPAYELKAYVEKRLSEIVAVRETTGLPQFPTAYRLGGRINNLTIGPGVVRPAQEKVSAKAFFYLPLVLNIAVTPTAPFAA
jgi:hypothetical protein